MRTAFATALVSAAVLGVSAAPGLSLSIVTPESVADVENLSVTAVVKNTGTETLKLLKDPRGVLSSAKTHTFNVANEKGSPQFTGMFVKYIEASTQSNKVALTGNLVSTRGLPKIESRSLGKRVAYVGCSTTRQSQIATAVTSANSYVSAATSYLNGISSGTTRYTTWFGTYSSSRASTVRSHFSAIGTDASSTTYDCSTCTSSAYAYVYANQPGRVYLCSAFWSAPNTGTDSRAGTIVHEQSHFTVNGGTQDIVYGQSGARSLASSSPDRAIQNADSHEYFAENNPAQS
ncbi:unnamed protein product [Rhizoctonia solani]|uniref:Lysine-specific metallo-endopeptidase domain-containing protein n=1 Tax=Rhizoctonia solani TaxID=456999 RepID=A0A8H2ZUU0_9AGAM|nr:unnamed protein product [Rhizoctonia solani]